MPFAKRGDVVHSEATSGFNNQKKSLLINGLAALGDSVHPLHDFNELEITPRASANKKEICAVRMAQFTARSLPHPFTLPAIPKRSEMSFPAPASSGLSEFELPSGVSFLEGSATMVDIHVLNELLEY